MISQVVARSMLLYPKWLLQGCWWLLLFVIPGGCYVIPSGCLMVARLLLLVTILSQVFARGVAGWLLGCDWVVAIVSLVHVRGVACFCK